MEFSKNTENQREPLAASGIEALWNMQVSKEVKEAVEISKQLKGKGFKTDDS